MNIAERLAQLDFAIREAVSLVKDEKPRIDFPINIDGVDYDIVVEKGEGAGG